jgi:hypothetical protein
MQAAKLTKVDIARKIATSPSQLDRALDPSNVSVQLVTLIKAARARDREIGLRRQSFMPKQPLRQGTFGMAPEPSEPSGNQIRASGAA